MIKVDLRCCEDLLMMLSRNVFWGATRPLRPAGILRPQFSLRSLLQVRLTGLRIHFLLCARVVQATTTTTTMTTTTKTKTSWSVHRVGQAWLLLLQYRWLSLVREQHCAKKFLSLFRFLKKSVYFFAKPKWRMNSRLQRIIDKTLSGIVRRFATKNLFSRLANENCFRQNWLFFYTTANFRSM